MVVQAPLESKQMFDARTRLSEHRQDAIAGGLNDAPQAVALHDVPDRSLMIHPDPFVFDLAEELPQLGGTGDVREHDRQDSRHLLPAVLFGALDVARRKRNGVRGHRSAGSCSLNPQAGAMLRPSTTCRAKATSANAVVFAPDLT